jgi:hypothetical protein
MATKICGNCNQEKDVSEFPIDYRYKEERRYATPCKECRKKYYSKEKNRVYGQRYLSKPNVKEKRDRYFKEYQKTDKYKSYHKTEKIKKYHREYDTTQEYRDYKNQYRKDNYELVRGRERIREVEYNKRPEVRIKRALRARLLTILKRSNGSKSGKMVALIGCTMPFLRQYLESLWKENMSWANYGFGRGRWVMDHIIPCERFDLTKPEEQRRCFHYTNIQPLWWEENAEKSCH